jgi:hypothetical protein
MQLYTELTFDQYFTFEGHTEVKVQNVTISPHIWLLFDLEYSSIVLK